MAGEPDSAQPISSQGDFTALIQNVVRRWDLPSVSIDPMPPGVNGEVALLKADQQKWVAKLAYTSREAFEPGLAVAHRMRSSSFAVASPVPSTHGNLVEMVEWPNGTLHPFAILDFVTGDPLAHSAENAPEIMGNVCGALAGILADVDPAEVGLDPATPFVPGERNDSWNLGDYEWLNDASEVLAERVHESLPDLPHGVAVWDGPEILLGPDGTGLVDFGTTAWMPRIHPIARGELLTSYNDRDRRQRFLAAVEIHAPLSERERAALKLFRLLNATVYARGCASQRTEYGLPDDHHLMIWLGQLVQVIETDADLAALTT